MNLPSALTAEDRTPEECFSTGFFSSRLRCIRWPFAISWPTQSQGRRSTIGPYRPACAAPLHRRYTCQPRQILGVARSPHLYGYPLIFYFIQSWEHDFKILDRMLLLTIWFLPLVTVPLSMWGLPITPLILGIFLFLLLIRLRRCKPFPSLGNPVASHGE